MKEWKDGDDDKGSALLTSCGLWSGDWNGVDDGEGGSDEEEEWIEGERYDHIVFNMSDDPVIILLSLIRVSCD
jgi:hypothetical protein